MSDRPNPLKEVASKVGVAWAAATGLVGALVTFGVISGAQAEAVNTAGNAAPDLILAAGTVIAGVAGLVGGIVSAFRTADAGKDHVTPLSSPRDNDGNVLVPDPAGSGPFAGPQL
jgi:hypothetical protein